MTSTLSILRHTDERKSAKPIDAIVETGGAVQCSASAEPHVSMRAMVAGDADARVTSSARDSIARESACKRQRNVTHGRPSVCGCVCGLRPSDLDGCGTQ